MAMPNEQLKRETRETVIGPYRVKVTKMLVTEASPIMTVLVGLLGSLGSHVDQALDGLKDMNLGHLAGGLMKFKDQLPEPEQRALEERLANNVLVNNVPLKQCTSTIDDLWTYLQILAFSVQVNFGRTFQGALELGGLGLKPANGSTGSTILAVAGSSSES